MRLIAFPSFVLACLVALAPAPAAGQACTDSNGTFRFLNTEFPDLSTNGPVFTGQLVVANADGPVTLLVGSGRRQRPASRRPHARPGLGPDHGPRDAVRATTTSSSSPTTA